MAVSPWAQLEQQANTAQNLQPPPGVFATPEMTGPPPDMPQQQTPQIARIPTAGEQQIAADQGQLQKVRWNQAHPWGTPENHPGKLGKVAHVFSEIGNIAGDVFAPGVMANIPQTQMGMKANEIGLTNRLNKEIGDESLNQERAATQAETEEKTREAPGKAQSEEELQGAQTYKALHPTEEWEQANGIAGPNGEVMEHNKTTGAYRVAPGAEGASLVSTDKTTGTPTAGLQKQLIDAENKGDTATANKLRQQLKDMNPQGEQRIVLQQQALSEKIPMIVPDGKGGHMIAYMQPGQSVPEGAVTPTQSGAGNAAAEKGQVGANKALTYANDYLKSGQYTGAGDEALQDQYFEMAKPSSGFRMNQAQIDQLHHMQSWMNSAEGAAYHAANGTWFSPQLRKEIVATMNALGRATGNKNAGSETNGPMVQHSASTGQYRYSTDGGKTWQNGQPPSQK